MTFVILISINFGWVVKLSQAYVVSLILQSSSKNYRYFLKRLQFDKTFDSILKFQIFNSESRVISTWCILLIRIESIYLCSFSDLLLRDSNAQCELNWSVDVPKKANFQSSPELFEAAKRKWRKPEKAVNLCVPLELHFAFGNLHANYV